MPPSQAEGDRGCGWCPHVNETDAVEVKAMELDTEDATQTQTKEPEATKGDTLHEDLLKKFSKMSLKGDNGL